LNFDMKDIVFPVAGGIASIVGWAVLSFLGKVEKSFERLTESIEKLNLSVALLTQQGVGLEKRVDRLEAEKGE